MNNSKQSAQSVSAILYQLQDYAKMILPQNHRIQVCQHVPSYWAQLDGSNGGVSRKPEGHHHLHGFGSCGDPRACPLCSNKIGLQRAEEIKTALAWHRRENGGMAMLVTFTCRHKLKSDLKTLAKGLAQAKRDFSSYRSVKFIKALLKYSYCISARDNTHSFVNGHHPHYHDIWLCHPDAFKPDYLFTLEPKFQNFLLKNKLLNDDNSMSIEKVRLFLAEDWIKACLKNDLLPPSLDNGFDIQYREKNGNEAVGAYLIKWAYELATPNKKVGRNDSMTPTQLLSAAYNSKGEFQYKYAKAWREYIEAYTGMASVYFGKGLKKAAGIEEVTDEELAERPMPVKVREFTHAERLAVVYYRAQRKVVFYYDNFSDVVAEAYLAEILRNYYDQKNSEIKMRWHLKRKIALSSSEIIANLFIQQIEQGEAA